MPRKPGERSVTVTKVHNGFFLTLSVNGKQKRGSTAIEKIRFFRKDYDERIEAFRENIDSIKQGTEERMEKRDEVWRAKVGMLENDLGVAWKRIAELEIAIYAIPGTLESRGTSAAQDNLTFIRKGTTK